MSGENVGYSSSFVQGKRGRLALAPLIFLTVLVGPAAAGTQDVYFEQVTVTSTEGEPAGPGVTSRVWLSGRNLRMEAGGAAGGPALLLLLDQGKAYRLDPEEKVAEEIALERLRSRSHADASVAGDLMGGAEEGSVRTSARNTSRTIAGHVCRDYRIAGPSVVMDVCMSREIPLGVDAFAEFLEWSGASQSLGGILAELRRLPGFPLETKTRVSVLGRSYQTRSTITVVRPGPQPRDLFQTPPGYKIVAERPEP